MRHVPCHSLQIKLAAASVRQSSSIQAGQSLTVFDRVGEHRLRAASWEFRSRKSEKRWAPKWRFRYPDAMFGMESRQRLFAKIVVAGS